MQLKLRSIYFQVLVYFLLIILSTLTISSLFDYYTYTSQLPRLFTEIRTKSIARHLSATYTRDAGWANLRPEVQRLINLESLNTLEDATLRIIIRDNNDKTLYNSFSNITRIENTELIEGESEQIIDFRTSETVGIVTIYISRDYIIEHSRVYILNLLKFGIYKGLITAAIAIFLSLLFSRRITRPVIKLTEAAQTITEKGSSIPVMPSSSDELGRLSRAFIQMLTSLQNQRESRKQLLSDVSHEINTPLNNIRLEARGLLDELVPSGEAALQIINEVDSLNNIVYDLDWLAETDSGEYKLNLERFPIDRLISEETARWIPQAAVRNHILAVGKLPDNLPSLNIDVIRISTVLGNLIKNAIKYSPDGSRITVGVKKNNSSIEISVCDEGQAINSDYREKIFDRFFRTGNSFENNEPGRGLGLSIAKKIAELHQGEIRLECGKDTGNCFIVMLPLFSE